MCLVGIVTVKSVAENAYSNHNTLAEDESYYNLSISSAVKKINDRHLGGRAVHFILDSTKKPNNGFAPADGGRSIRARFFFSPFLVRTRFVVYLLWSSSFGA